MTLFIIILIVAALSFYAYKKRRWFKRQYIKMKIDARRKKRKSLVFEDHDQRKVIQIAERMIRESSSQLFYTSRSDDYFVWSGDIYIIFNSRVVTIINGKVDMNVLISDKIYDSIKEKFNTRLEINRKKLVSEIERKSGLILDIISNDIDEHFKTKTIK